MIEEHHKSVLLIAEWNDPRFQLGVAHYARQAGWRLNLDSIYTPHFLPHGWRGDGCIAMAGHGDLIEFIESLKVPVVDVTHQVTSKFTRIHEDDRAIGELAATYFLGLGFKHFACYRTDPFSVSTVRQESFTEAIAGAGYTTTQILWDRFKGRDKRTWAQRRKFLAREVTALPKPTAVFCIDDRMAVNIIDACLENDIRMPDEIAVLGVGNLETACECSVVSLSSIRFDYEVLGFQAAELLDGLMQGKSPPAQPVLLPPQGIEERRSTYTLAVEDPAGQKALRFMLDHFTSPIGVQDIAQAAGLTRRQLTYITQQELNIPPAKLLEDVRIKKARELLSTTNFTVERVAQETGLGSALRIQRIFRKRFDISPAAWRKANRVGE